MLLKLVHRPKPAAPVEAQAVFPVLSGNGEKILVIDDESCLLDLMVRALCAAGYAAVGARDRSEALSALDRVGGVDLVVTDLMLARDNGIAVLSEMKQREPQSPMRALLISGSLGSPRNKFDLQRHHLLAKPFTKRQLLEAIEEALTGRR